MPGKPKKRHPVIQPLETSYRFIALTRGQNAIVDAVDFEWLSQWNWYAVWSKYTKSFYATREPGIKMHRVILGCTERREEGDHKNRNTLDNRRENLRKATRSQNASNTNRHSKWGYKGVRFDIRVSKKWISRIVVNGKHIHLGCFSTIDEAARAYDEAAKRFHGEFAVLNFH